MKNCTQLFCRLSNVTFMLCPRLLHKLQMSFIKFSRLSNIQQISMSCSCALHTYNERKFIYKAIWLNSEPRSFSEHRACAVCSYATLLFFRLFLITCENPTSLSEVSSNEFSICSYQVWASYSTACAHSLLKQNTGGNCVTLLFCQLVVNDKVMTPFHISCCIKYDINRIS